MKILKNIKVGQRMKFTLRDSISICEIISIKNTLFYPEFKYKLIENIVGNIFIHNCKYINTFFADTEWQILNNQDRPKDL